MFDIREKPTEEQIARRAYVMYLNRGGETGRDVDDRLAAEIEFVEQDSSSPQKTRAAAAGQGRSSVLSDTDSEHGSSAHEGERYNRHRAPARKLRMSK